jgi:two-component system CheB/CheR fusion protein
MNTTTGTDPVRPDSAPSGVPTAHLARAIVPVVAIGASAGGLDALSKLLDVLPAKTGMAYVIVQHLDPTHKSLLAELLAEHTAMPVAEAVDGSPLVADQVHVIAPGCYLTVADGALRVSVPDARHGARMPFDALLRSLALACGPRAIGVVMTGTGQDGSAGLAALKLAGGHVLAQAPEEAEYPGMPRAAVRGGHVDEVLALAAIPDALARIAHQIATSPAAIGGPPRPVADTDPAMAAGMAAILDHLRDSAGHDFRAYKPGTIARRITRRMGLAGIAESDPAAYLALLLADPAENAVLASDLLINVTRFFRDPKVFATLESMIVPQTIRALPPGQALRVWVAGCSTGEEAYSVAMICLDAIAASGREIRLQIFASDIDPDAIATARDGRYGHDIADHVPADRLARHFLTEEDGFRVTQALRGAVVFSVQDVLTDPPFSRMNLITCRNLLIYLNTAAQAKVIALFHFALRADGTLLLGTAETIGRGEDRFEPVPDAECCYRHVARSRSGGADFAFNLDARAPMLAAPDRPAPDLRQASLADICNRAVLARHAPAAVLINRKHECLFSIGPVGRFLRVAPGYATLDVLAMASPALRTRLRLAINRTGRDMPRVDGGHAYVTIDGAQVPFRIEAESLTEAGEDLVLVSFIEGPAAGAAQAADAEAERSPEQAARIAELEHDLAQTQAELQTSIHERAIVSQEQKAINEEALSVNEEFQSTNEELLTSKEELQSLNEELTALNSQLQETLDRQRLASDDLQNVMYSTNVGTMFLDTGLHIRFFNPAIKPMFNVIAGDVGRPLGDLRPLADDPALLCDAQAVRSDGTTFEREIRAPDDSWHLRRMIPYRAHDGQIGGVVITYTDITERKRSTAALEAAKLEAERANAAKSRFLAAASHDLRQPLQLLTLLKDQIAEAVKAAQPAVEPRTSDLLARFDQGLHALSGMLDVLLNINQIETGTIHPQRREFPVAQVMDRLRAEFAPLATARNLVLDILPSTARIETDPHLLEQMLRNLLGNAVKYTRTGRIMVGCRHRGTDLRIEVRDTGIGIAESHLHDIFEEFHQVNNPARERSQGLGLGLAIVQRLGQLLGHAIDVHSVPDKGSVFSITVPASQIEIAPSPSQPAGSDLPAGIAVAPVDRAGDAATGQATIIVVEDDPDLLDLLAQLLRSNGHNVGCAANAATATELIAHGAIRPDILLTDYNLPTGKTGVELVVKLRADLQRDLPAIVLTGDISTETLARISSADCMHLSKPIEARALLLAIARLCPPSTVPTCAPVAPVPGSGTAPPVTFIIDDEAQIRSALRELLIRHGQTVADFDSGGSFLAAYHPGAAACLLVDARLPGISGMDLLNTLRARGDHVPVIMITGTWRCRAGGGGDARRRQRIHRKAGGPAGTARRDRTRHCAIARPAHWRSGPRRCGTPHCRSDRSAKAGAGHGAGRAPQQEHCRRSGDQPAHRGKSPSRNHAPDGGKIDPRTGA